VNPKRPPHIIVHPAPTPAGGGQFRPWVAFWFTPVDPVGLHVVRVLAGLLFLAWLLPLAGQVEPFFGLYGWFDRQALNEAARVPGGPPQALRDWSIAYLCGANATLLQAVYWASVPPSLAANVALRLLQVHLALVILVSGLSKLQFGAWWSGMALWYPLHPPFRTTIETIRALVPERTSYLFVLSVGAYAVMAWEIGFPCFAWRPRWRLLLLGGALVSWAGLAFIYQMPLFGPAVFIGCLAFVTPAEWYRLFGWLGRVPGLSWLQDRLPAPAELDGTAMRREKAPSLAAARRP
jgi:hypothetical protein